MRKILVAVRVPSQPIPPRVAGREGSRDQRDQFESLRRELERRNPAVVEVLAIDNSPIATNRGASKGKSARTLARNRTSPESRDR